MSLRLFFLEAAEHAEELLRRPRAFGERRHPLYRNRASELATRAITRAMVTEDGELRLSREEAAHVREVLVGWQPEYQNDVPGRLRWFASQAERR